MIDSIELICPESTSDTGAYRIAWNNPSGAVVRVEENDVVLYEGTDVATTVSGRPRGDYIYRAGEVGRDGAVSAWSDACTVTVDPPPLSLALTLFGVGFAVFVALLIAVARGHQACRRPVGATSKEAST